MACYYVGLGHSIYVKGTNTFFLERASLSSLPFAIDDPPKISNKNSGIDINDLIVDLYNGCKTANLKVGSLQPPRYTGSWQRDTGGRG